MALVWDIAEWYENDFAVEARPKVKEQKMFIWLPGLTWTSYARI